MKKFWILTVVLCSMTIGCKPAETTTAPATPAASGTEDEHAGHTHAEGEEHTEDEAAPAEGE